MKGIAQFLRDERGLETVEYAVVAALIILATVVAIQALGGAVSDTFDNIVSEAGLGGGD